MNQEAGLHQENDLKQHTVFSQDEKHHQECAGDLTARISALEAENRELRAELNQRDFFIRSTFGSYLTNEVLDELLKQQEEGLAIRGESRVVTMLFTDLRGSTALSEQMNSGDFIRMLNHYYAEMIEIVNTWLGNILDFVGDAIVAVYGAPKENRHAANDAIACAVAMQRRMIAVNAWNREQGYPELAMGIGIHTGKAVLGTIGSQVRAKYDMIGRNVNLASRIQSYAEGGQILISTEALEAAGQQVVLKPDGEKQIRPKGIVGDVTVYDVIGYGKQRIPGWENGPEE